MSGWVREDITRGLPLRIAEEPVQRRVWGPRPGTRKFQVSSAAGMDGEREEVEVGGGGFFGGGIN
jgi:hypothetical protein